MGLGEESGVGEEEGGSGFGEGRKGIWGREGGGLGERGME